MASTGRIETDSPRPKTEDTTQTLTRLEENLKDYLKDKLKPVAHKWHPFGIQLHIPRGRLDTLKAMKRPYRECFQEMIHYWLENDTKHYWKKIFDALNKIDRGSLRKKLEEKYSPANLVELSETELINTLNGIQYKWKDFGRLLGVPSDELNIIAQDKSDDDCLNDVIDLWFNNYKPTLETLCQALRNVQKAKLASEIYQILCERDELTSSLNDLTLESPNPTISQQTSALSKQCQPSLTCLSSNHHVVETDSHSVKEEDIDSNLENKSDEDPLQHAKVDDASHKKILDEQNQIAVVLEKMALNIKETSGLNQTKTQSDE